MTYRIQVNDLQLRTLLDLAYQEYKNNGESFYKDLVHQIEGKSPTTEVVDA